MRRGKIERESKKEKRDFCLGGAQEEGENKVLPHSRRHKESMCKSKERGSRTRNKKKREQSKGSLLEKKEDSQERAVHGEENKKKRTKCCRL